MYTIIADQYENYVDRKDVCIRDQNYLQGDIPHITGTASVSMFLAFRFMQLTAEEDTYVTSKAKNDKLCTKSEWQIDFRISSPNLHDFPFES